MALKTDDIVLILYIYRVVKNYKNEPLMFNFKKQILVSGIRESLNGKLSRLQIKLLKNPLRATIRNKGKPARRRRQFAKNT